MIRAERKFVLDTNLFIDGFRDRAAGDELLFFHRLFAPFEFLSAVVVHELCAGTRSKADLRLLERSVLTPFADRGRLVTPSYDAWVGAGQLLARLAREDGLALHTVSRAFGHDVLLALSCREAGLTLVTRNRKDFARIAKLAPFRFEAPWPAPSS